MKKLLSTILLLSVFTIGSNVLAMEPDPLLKDESVNPSMAMIPAVDLSNLRDFIEVQNILITRLRYDNKALLAQLKEAQEKLKTFSVDNVDVLSPSYPFGRGCS